MIYNAEQRESILEKFVGSSDPRMQEIEKCVTEIVKMINEGTFATTDVLNLNTIEARQKKFGSVKGYTTKEINDSKANKRLEKLFADFFQLEDMFMFWDTLPSPNAFTLCKTFLILDKNQTTKLNGQHVGKGKLINVTVMAELVRTLQLTPREVLAIILHEVGHNFYNSPFQILASLPLNFKTIVSPNVANTIIGSLAGLLLRDLIPVDRLYKKTAQTVYRFLHKYRIIEDMYRLMGTIFANADNIVSIIRMILNSGEDIKSMLHIYKTGQIFTFWLDFNFLFLYNVEKYADSFATDYGYGADMMSALEKLSSIHGAMLGGVTQEKRVSGFIGDYMTLLSELNATIVSGYPSNQNRMRTVLDRTRRSLKDETLHPKVRKELEQQLKDCEHFYYNEYLDKDRVSKRGMVYSWMSRNLIEKCFGGKMDFREIIHAIDPKKYE